MLVFAQRVSLSKPSAPLGKALATLAAALVLSGCACAPGDNAGGGTAASGGTATVGGGRSSADTWLDECKGAETYDLCFPADRVADGEPLYALTPVDPSAVGNGGAPAKSSQGGAPGYGGMAGHTGKLGACVPTDCARALETTGFHTMCGYELSAAPVVQRDDLCCYRACTEYRCFGVR